MNRGSVFVGQTCKAAAFPEGIYGFTGSYRTTTCYPSIHASFHTLQLAHSMCERVSQAVLTCKTLHENGTSLIKHKEP